MTHTLTLADKIKVSAKCSEYAVQALKEHQEWLQAGLLRKAIELKHEAYYWSDEALRVLDYTWIHQLPAIFTSAEQDNSLSLRI